MWPDLCSLILALVLIEGVRSRSSDVTWVSPSKGESFRPGDKILCKWTADKAVVSPSFQLCMAPNDSTLEERSNDSEETDSDMDCGETMWPTVEQTGGEYTISLAVPDVTVDGSYTLRMKDDFGLKFETSSFSLHSTPAVTDSVSTPSDGAQVPLGSPAYSSSTSAAVQSSDSNVANTSSSATVASTVYSTAVPLAKSNDDANLNPSATASSNVHSSSTRPHPSTSAKSDPLRTNTSSPVPTTSTSRAVNTSSPSVTPQDLATRMAPSAAAVAVPLSAIGAILVIAAGLAVLHRRKLGEERMKDAEKLALSRQSSINSYKSAGEVQYALGVLSRHDIGIGAAPAPVPLFMPVERESLRREPRRSTKMAFAPASYGPASYAAPTPSVRSSESVRTTKSRPLLTRSGLSSRSDAHTLVGAGDAAGWDEDPATHSVIADYIIPSPPLPSSLLAAPQRARVRDEAPSLPASSHKNNYGDKPLPPSPPGVLPG